MNEDDYKKYTEQAQRGIKGEAFFETIVSEYSLAHRIVGPKDIGIDYVCQWVFKSKPRRILYGVQVKTFSKKKAKCEYIGVERGFNCLRKYKITNHHLKIDRKNLKYWQTLSMPIYLFVVVDNAGKMSCYYKRYTPILTKDNIDEVEVNFYSSFYEVNENNSFIAFADKTRRVGGFARDLFIDYIRLNYYNGSVTYLNPRSIGLGQFPDQQYAIFKDLFEIYENKILLAYNQTTRFLQRYRSQNA